MGNTASTRANRRGSRGLMPTRRRPLRIAATSLMAIGLATGPFNAMPAGASGLLPGAVTTVAGSGSATTSAGTGTAAGLNAPVATAYASGAVYIAGSDYIAKFNTSTSAVTVLAGSPGTAGCADASSGAASTFTGIFSLATDGTNLYAASRCGVRKTVIATGATSTFPGTSTRSEGVTWPGDGYVYSTTGDGTSNAQILRTDPLSVNATCGLLRAWPEP